MNHTTTGRKSNLRCVITCSTGGAVMNECLKSPFFRSLIHSVVCDRPCAGADKARAQGMPVEVFEEVDGHSFCERLLDYLKRNQIDYVFSFYTLFYSRELRDAYPDRLINLHPSLLPAFKGNDAWEYVRSYRVRFAGSTVEFIHERMDQGKIILQSAFPWDDQQSERSLRHCLFVQQCKSLLQVAQWLADSRIRTDGVRVLVDRARFDSAEFSPALDFEEAIGWECPIS